MARILKRHKLGLAAYLALTWAGSGESVSYPQLQHGLPVVWVHVGSPKDLPAIIALCNRLIHLRGDVQIVLTGHVPLGGPDVRGLLWMAVPVPAEPLVDVQEFLNWARPELCLWTGNDLRPSLLSAAAERGCRLVLLNVSDKAFALPSLRWVPEAAAATLDLFSDIFTEDDPAGRRVRRMNVNRPELHHAGLLQDAPAPLPVNHNLREEVAAQIGGRPVWLAAHVAPDELSEVLRAHRQACRYSHRLLLVVTLNAPEDHSNALQHLVTSGQRFCDWDDGGDIEETTQVVLSGDPAELGLWFGIAPVAYLGSSLVPGFGGHDPMGAATLGSAILYGPNVGKHLAAYSRLAEAGAARIVRDASSLASAVTAVIPPDQSATMAHAGWEIISRGAEMVDQLIAIALETLDAAEET